MKGYLRPEVCAGNPLISIKQKHEHFLSLVETVAL